ncbi:MULTISPECIES: hypothetical protein [unclassified Streptomyces]|uniref:hypothetical protein n=1 Tax=unclassified Streptomyces TaxID=2593676 RepID=UPI000DBA92B0|nr:MULTISPECIES: hypothetical protein [unclassified Streptomyces]MYT70407.1 hypothetical protein [Streptomyces sp. SID8367]
MGVVTTGTLRTMQLDSLVGLTRRRRTPHPHPPAPVRLTVPDGMTAPLGCDAVAVPESFARAMTRRLPRMGCVYAAEGHWWWLVPSDSDVALEWPAPARYTAGAVVPDAARVPDLIHCPESAVPYTPPIPLYLALCRVTGTTPAWSRSVGTS